MTERNLAQENLYSQKFYTKDTFSDPVKTSQVSSFYIGYELIIDKEII